MHDLGQTSTSLSKYLDWENKGFGLDQWFSTFLTMIYGSLYFFTVISTDTGMFIWHTSFAWQYQSLPPMLPSDTFHSVHNTGDDPLRSTHSPPRIPLTSNIPQGFTVLFLFEDSMLIDVLQVKKKSMKNCSGWEIQRHRSCINCSLYQQVAWFIFIS